MNTRSALPTVAFAAAAIMTAFASPALASNEGLFDEARVRAATPSCSANPDATWIGRVSGQMSVQLDRSKPVSFVGCFPTRATCERWKTRASGIIDRRIIQYSCNPRG